MGGWRPAGIGTTAAVASLQPGRPLSDGGETRESRHGSVVADIARSRFMSEATVKAHVSRLSTTLDVTNRVQIAIVVHDAAVD